MGITRSQYQNHNLDRNVFNGKKILVMVPHQDDEINLFGGLYENFNSSDVFVMFSTNGDRKVSGETRIMEAVNALDQMGIDREHIIFLGYGDSAVSESGVQMYNLPGDEVVMSFADYTETYAAYGFQPYRHSPYTRDNMKNDIKTLLLDLKPEVIFCIDYDAHHDHRALSLLFEEAIGEILRRKENDYTPLVFKGFAYSTAFLGEPDFYADNIRSTVPYSESCPFPGDFYINGNGVQIFYMGENNIYLWNNRLRFPVAENNLSRTLRSSNLYQAMKAHQSQEFLYSAMSTMPSIINGDKVFWLRSTSGILYNAEISVSSGDGSVLTDFKLTDSSDIYDKTRKPFENLWTPDPEDRQKTATFTFSEKTAIDSICLYDNPCLTDNISGLRILFSDGTEMKCGPLAINGSATIVKFEEKNILSFSIQILEAEGNQPGLSEVEAYLHNDPRNDIPEIIKLKNQDGDFVYDYWMTDTPEEFTVYNSLDSFEAYKPKNYSLKVLTGNCKITKNRNDSFTVSCGKGSSADLALYVEGKDSPVDLVTVRNPFSLEKWWTSLLIEAEKNWVIYSPLDQFLYFKQLIMDYCKK